MIPVVTTRELELLLKVKAFTVVHFDAEWDAGYRQIARAMMERARAEFDERVTFVEVDADQETALCLEVGLLNVPTYAVFKNGTHIASLTGAEQDLNAFLRRLAIAESAAEQ